MARAIAMITPKAATLEGNGVAGAQLRLQPENGNPLGLRERERLLPPFVTDQNGYFRRPHLAAGDWSVTATAKKHTEGRSPAFAVEEEQATDIEDIRLGPGTLYRSIQRMLIDGLIEELEIALHDESDDDRRRHYRLTKKGLEIAQREARRLADLVEVARQRSLLVKRSGAARPSSPRKGGRRDRSRP